MAISRASDGIEPEPAIRRIRPFSTRFPRTDRPADEFERFPIYFLEAKSVERKGKPAIRYLNASRPSVVNRLFLQRREREKNGSSEITRSMIWVQRKSTRKKRTQLTRHI